MWYKTLLIEVRLPSLRKLDMSGHPLHCAALLARLSLPPSVLANLGGMYTPFEHEPDTEEETLEIVGALRPLISKLAPDSTEPLLACLWDEFAGRINILGWSKVVSFFGITTSQARMHIAISATDTSVDGFCQHLPLSSIRSLSFQGYDYYDQAPGDASTRLLRSLSNIEELCLEEVNLYWTDTLFALVDGQHPFPKLQALYLRRIGIEVCSEDALSPETCIRCVHRLEHILSKTDAEGSLRKFRSLRILQPVEEGLISHDELKLLISNIGSVDVLEVVDRSV